MELYFIGCVVALLVSLSLFVIGIKEGDVDKPDIPANIWVIIFASLFSWITVAIAIAIIVFAI